MKTRDRILQCALQLFNEQGEPNVSTLEIATEMVKPGRTSTTMAAALIQDGRERIRMVATFGNLAELNLEKELRDSCADSNYLTQAVSPGQPSCTTTVTP